MHAAKQASWLKRRQPDLDIAVFYTDLRAPGKGQEAYMKMAEELGVRFIRRRPGLVAPVDGPSGKGIALRHEADADVATTLADIVVLNGGLACCPCPEGTAEVSAQACGFCSEPADIANSVIQAGNAAALICGGQTGDGALCAAFQEIGGRS
jgi:heterodisulfide reductase subunit A-like polyferredoxin